MAKATTERSTRTKMVEVEETVTVVNLTLTEREALLIFALIGSTQMSVPEVGRIYNALYDELGRNRTFSVSNGTIQVSENLRLTQPAT